MLALGFTVAVFLVWFGIGLAALTALRADVRQLRVVLTAPVLGTALNLIPLFVLSNLGFGMTKVARPTCVVLIAASAGVLAWRRPRLPLAILPVLGVCVADLLLLEGARCSSSVSTGIANANGDMAYYVLSATHLMKHGLQSAVDARGLADNRSFSSSAQTLNLRGL